MRLCVLIVLSVFFAKSCEGKPTKFQGYPEENRNIHSLFSSELLEGDMLVGAELKKVAMAGGDVAMANSRKRGATKGLTWPNGVIPYVIDSSLNADKSAIENAMDEWESGSCVSFVPFNNTSDVYLKIMSTYHGCFSAVGYRDVSAYPAQYKPFGSPLNLGDGCLSRRVILHELGHALGFWHEQSRPDRDTFVEIVHENIAEGKEHEFNKYSNQTIDSLGVDYDYRSVMHYRPTEFSKSPDKVTIKSRNENITLEVNHNISDKDKEQLNLLYNCA